MLIRMSGVMSYFNLSTMSFKWSLENPEPAQGDRSSLTTERVFNIDNVAETYLAGKYVDMVSKFVSCTMYIEEVLDTVEDQFIGCVLALGVVSNH